MKVLMLGWEFPPYFAGGVGVVCHSLTAALSRRSIGVTYVMPSGPEHIESEHVRLLVASRLAPNVQVTRLGARLTPYASLAHPGTSATSASSATVPGGAGGHVRALYGANLLEEIERFSLQLSSVVKDLELDFDVIHAHDWTTFPAGLAVSRLTGKPLLVHVHITEFDKTGGHHADPETYAIEKAGMDGAQLVVTVSHRVGQMCAEKYFVDPGKIRVVHNGVEGSGSWALGRQPSPFQANGDRKVVLYLGRVTLQKGPDYFIEAARRVLEHRKDVTFIMAGNGDMLPRMIERTASLGIAENVLFAGFVSRDQALSLYRQADVYVMPSVSEPFGVAPLEAMTQGVPVLVSRQSGVSEVVRHAMKFDFWDVDDLAQKILASLAYPTLARELRHQGRRESESLNWDAVAGRVAGIYDELRRSA